MLLQTIINQLIPGQVRNYIWSIIKKYFSPKNSSDFHIVIEERDGISSNELYQAAELYLHTMVGPETDSLKVIKRPAESNISLKFAKAEKVVDSFQGAELKWIFDCEEWKKGSKSDDDSDDHYFALEKRYFTLGFDKKHKDMILSSYVPFLLKKAHEIRAQNKALRLHTLHFSYSSIIWDSVVLQHPSTFDTLAIDSGLKKAITDDLDRFLKRKDFYKKVGKAWKRGYLLYGPPGTGKSSLIAAMANYLKFDIYDMELANVRNDSDLRKLLLRTANRSILVIEDIDCSVKLPNRAEPTKEKRSHPPTDQTFTLSGLLNFIDGLWSSCGVERIIIFTTNNKDKLDPALLRPGRMDLHVHMSYLTIDGFRVFAKNYLDIDEHWRFEEIEELIKKIDVSPAEVAEELMKSDDADVSLEGLVHFLRAKTKKTQINDDDDEKDKEQKLQDRVNGEIHSDEANNNGQQIQVHQNGDATSSTDDGDDESSTSE